VYNYLPIVATRSAATMMMQTRKIGWFSGKGAQVILICFVMTFATYGKT
jgi:hypothetical protein